MKTLPTIKAISFDAGGTLITPKPSVGHVYAEVAARHGIRIPPGVLNKRFSTAWSQRLEFNHRREEWAAIVNDTFAGLTDVPPGPLPFFDELYQRFEEPDAWQIYEDVLPALEELSSSGMPLGIISNWDERLRPLLHRLELDGYFQSIVISCEIGFTKPSPVIFHEASKKLGIAPEHILHVGDSSKHDAAGAQTAGFQWRLIDRKANEQSENTIASLSDLGEFIQ